MKKTESFAFGKKCYLLGADDDGVWYWLEESKFECGWYWGGGYVETYTNNKTPSMSKDIKSHMHFDCMFFNNHKNAFHAFKEFFAETPLTDGDIWKLCELLKSFYVARAYSDMLHIGGAHYTSNPARETIKSDEEYERINKKLIPSIMEEVYRILGADV